MTEFGFKLVSVANLPIKASSYLGGCEKEEIEDGAAGGGAAPLCGLIISKTFSLAFSAYVSFEL
jgi:hypothetical protein